MPARREARRGRPPIRLLVAFAFALSTTGLAQYEEYLRSYEVPSSPAEENPSQGTVTVTFRKTADWDAGLGLRGYSANVTIVNQTGEALSPWELQFELAADIDSMWNATFVREGGQITVAPVKWNERLIDSRGRTFGFSGTYVGHFGQPTSYLLRGLVARERVAPEVSCDIQATVDVTSRWPKGAGTTGYTAEVFVTNTGPVPEDWSLVLYLPADATEFWNASFESVGSSGLYTVTPRSWSGQLEPEETVSFGYESTYRGEYRQPLVITCPDDVDPLSALASELVLRSYLEAYAALSLEDKVRVAAGRLRWNGVSFSVPPAILMPAPPGVTGAPDD